MKEFEYKVSVIVPVYNVEEYLSNCLESLLMQTISHKEMEILLIDDGSTDNSLMICQEYAELFDIFKVYTQENVGVSATRNRGIFQAKGKYILFLDADDTLTPETVKEVMDYFDTVYEEVDLVTYKIIPYKNGVAQAPHFRYKYMTKTGIYDLNEYPYCIQTTMNIVVKNDKRFHFDTELDYHEDQKYITEILADKMKIGYCHKGEYKYNKHSGSAIYTRNYSYYMFEKRMELGEKYFSAYEGEVPRYIQNMVLTDFFWEQINDTLLPYHYKGNKYTEAYERIQNLLAKVDISLIIDHPQMDTFHKHFWLSLKKNISPIVVCNEDNISILIDGQSVYNRSNVEIIVNKIDAEKGMFIVRGFIKSPIFNYIKEMPELYVVTSVNRKEKVELFESINSCYKTTAKTNLFWGFCCEIKQIDLHEIYFTVVIDGIEYCTSFYLLPSAIINKEVKIDSFVRDSKKISIRDNRIVLEECNFEQKQQVFSDNTKKQKSGIQRIRNIAIKQKAEKRIWLYSDSRGIGTDNAYYQFQHDWKKKDGVQRIYVCDGNKNEMEEYFSEEQRKNLVNYGTDIHKILYLSAEYVFTSFIDARPRLPFLNDAEYAFYRDMEQPKVIYLQHGVLHADLQYTQSAERCKVDKIVVSSYFECENYVNNYHYRKEDIIPVGAPRYDYIHKEKKAKNRIIFAPSWRSYLTAMGTDNLRTCDYSVLTNSDYFTKFMTFLSDKRLEKFLEEHDLYIDAKIHQNMRDAVGMLHFDNDRVQLVDSVEIEDYKLFITDISSYVFDFAYLNRPIFYFVPDMEQFESGMNHYRKLDLPFEEAFGKLVLTPEDAVNELIRIVENNFVSDEIYSKRMEEFFLPMEDCCEKLYEILKKDGGQ